MRLRRDIVQPRDADDGRRQGGRNLRIADIGEASDAVDVEIMDIGVKCGANLTGRAGKVDRHPVGKHLIDGEAALLQPIGDGLDVRGCRAELRAQLLGAKPLMVVRRIRIVQLIDQRLQRLLLRRRAPQLQQHMRHRHGVGRAAAIVGGISRCCRDVARKPEQAAIIDRLRDQGLRPSTGRLRQGRLHHVRRPRCETERHDGQRAAGHAEAPQHPPLAQVSRISIAERAA